MKVLIAIVLVLAALIGSVQLIGNNLQEVTIQFTGDIAVTTTVMKLVILCVLIGVFIGLLVHLYYNMGQRVQDRRRKKQEKKDHEVNELYLEGRSRVLSQDMKNARAKLQKALERDPKRREVAMALAEVEAAEGHLDQSRELWKKVHKEDPQEIESLLRNAQACREHGQVNDAIQAYQETLKIDKDNPKAHRGLRDLFISAARWNDAIDVQKRLIKLTSTDHAEREKRMLVCLRYEQALEMIQGELYDKAVGELKDLSKHASNFTPAFVSLGDALLAQGKLSDAIKRWQQGYTSFEEGVFLARIEDAYLKAEDPASLLTLYRSLLKDRPKDLLLRLYFGRLALRLELIEEAVEHLQVVESSGVQFAMLHQLLADAYARRDQKDEAIAEYKKALRSEETDIGYQCNHCGAEFDLWLGRCDACGDWGGFRLSGREVLEGPAAVETREIHHGEREVGQ